MKRNTCPNCGAKTYRPAWCAGCIEQYERKQKQKNKGEDMEIIYSRSEFIENGGTLEGFYRQWENIKKPIKNGDVFTTFPGNWQQSTELVIFANDDVVLCKRIDGIGKGSHSLYSNKPYNRGWRHEDFRPSYRLQTIKKES